MDLFNEIQRLSDKLTISIKNLVNNGKAFAEAEKEYKTALCKEALRLKNEKDMKVTLINQVIYGMPDVALKRYERDVAEAMYKANQESINVTKIQLRILENQLSREWSNTK